MAHAAPPVVAAPLVVLGIDPGLRRTGFALLRQHPRSSPELCEAGWIRLDPALPLGSRLSELMRSLAGLIADQRPAAVACEELYAHYKHPRTAILMAHARGVILCAAAEQGIPILPVAARQVKKVLTGSGKAGKAQVQHAVAATFGLARLPEPSDVADAIAIGLCGLQLLLQEPHLCAAMAARPAGIRA